MSKVSNNCVARQKYKWNLIEFYNKNQQETKYAVDSNYHD
jgi:hypothetical protein